MNGGNNNQNAGVLMGRNQMFNQQNTVQPQGQPQQNLNQGNQFLGQLINLAKVGAGNVHQAGGTGSGLYNFGNGTDPSMTQFLDLGDVNSTEILKQQMLAEASQLAGMIFQHGMRKVNGPLYNAIGQGMQLFRRLDRNNPHLIDDTSELFYNQIMSNNNLYQHIVANSCLQISALAATRMMNGENVKNNVNVISEIITDAVGATCGLQLLDWICRHPSGSAIYHNSSIAFKNLLRKIEECWDSIKARYDFIPGSVIPWERGQLSSMMKKNDVPNYMLDARMGSTYDGIVGNSYQAVQDLTPFNHVVKEHSNAIDPAAKKLMDDYFNRTRCAVEEGTYPTAPVRKETNREHFDLNGFDHEMKNSKYFTMETRFDYRMDDYFKEIPGTGWYVTDNLSMINIMAKYTNRNTGKPFKKAEVFYLNTQWVSLCRFDVSSGTGEIKFLQIPGEDALTFALTDPSKVLPFMWEENGEVKSTFTARVAETNDYLQEGKIISLGECTPLEKEPNILSSSNIVKVGTEAEAFSKLEGVLKTFDRSKHLDAFIMPTELNTPFTFEDGITSERAYNLLEPLIVGNKLDYSNSYDLFKDIERRVKLLGSDIFTQFIRAQMTNMMNRWLTESRNFPDHDDGVNYFVKLDDLFDDLDAFCEELKRNDHESLRVFLNLEDNEFIQSNLQFIKPKEEAKEQVFKNVDKEDVIAVSVAQNEFNQSVILKRNVVITQLRKEIGSSRDEKVTLMNSLSPNIFAIVKEARKRSLQHFGYQAPVLLEFETPAGMCTRSATYSDFDQDVMNISPLVGMGELILLRTRNK